MSLIERALASVRGVAMNRGWLEYRAVDVGQGPKWDREYADGEYDYFSEIHESARYGVLIGYIRQLGGSPSILDVGCGSGLLVDRIAPSDFESYLGIDPSQVAIARARAMETDRVVFRVADRLDPVLGRFDVLVLNEVLMVVRDPEAILDDALRLVRPGGHVVSSVWRHPGDQALLRMIDNRYDIVDAVDVRNLTGRRRARWRISCHRRPTE
jgi:2-polyprenyl-6-hydroxyphenyl methylase/3-demethylubiquinone-9 3-methyltransferase